ncbi:uncharacterized protein LOC142823134 isoform X2 [Pelodiscus sinensis]|uniref:uncharacterized protein LOC142823134 isoform X2 n=1 Tax=Pelodiscus sinensis TaxID=13735 RepID=UPI003F6C5112
MEFRQGWVSLGLELSILLVLCLYLPGGTSRSVQLPEEGAPGRSRRQADSPLSSEEDVMEFFKPLVRVLQEIPAPTLPSSAAIWSWIPALFGPTKQESTPGQVEKPAASASPRMRALEQPVSVKPPVPKTPFTAPPPHLEHPVSIQPPVLELDSSVRSATEEPDFTSEKEAW